MTACIERLPATPADGMACEGRRGMTVRPERQPAGTMHGIVGEGWLGLPEGGTA